jgi:hypothetical protein
MHSIHSPFCFRNGTMCHRDLFKLEGLLQIQIIFTADEYYVGIIIIIIIIVATASVV